jgi:hypothetical protein
MLVLQVFIVSHVARKLKNPSSEIFEDSDDIDYM